MGYHGRVVNVFWAASTNDDIATGFIARVFTKDILIDPQKRDVNDIIHQITAVASSSSIESAKKFMAEEEVAAALKQQSPPT